MNILYNDGAVTVFDKLSGDNEYDVGNKLINARFDGRGGVSRYAVINKFEALDYLHTLFSIDGIPLNFSEDKTVTVIGKKMTVKLRAKKADIEIRQFLSEDDNAVFIKLIVSAIEDISFKAVVNFGVNYKSYMQEFFLSRFSVTGLLKAASGMLKKHIGITKHEIKNDITGDFYIDFASDNELIPLESNFMFVNQFKTETYIKSREARVINVVMSSGTRNDFSAVKASELLKKIDEAEREADDYISSLKRYPEDVSEKEKALYASCLNCALSNYKEKGRFKGFLAGLVYQFPARTYFRDGYWTCLPVIAVRPEAVRNQILTLSKGMGRNGECPSAVKSSFKKYWGDHCDSPSFFTLLLYDYVAHTGDFSILQEKAGRDTVLSVAVKAVERLANKRTTQA
ncbi:MAG: hypothetical protein LBQ27_05215 [Clostridiales bacterium]|jgi:hypothetical protein|nr:hypothetical protein [Clostridiales bacterium]